MLSSERSVADAKSMVTALRSLLRFLFVTGRIDRELAAAVPTVANRKLSTLPGRLRAGEAGLLLGSCDRDTEVGRRDFAILTVLAALFAYINHRFIRLPGTIGIMFISLLLSLALIVAGWIDPGLLSGIIRLVKSYGRDVPLGGYAAESSPNHYPTTVRDSLDISWKFFMRARYIIPPMTASPGTTSHAQI